MAKYLFFILLSFASLSAYSASVVEGVNIAPEELSALAAHPTWHKLLHYEKDRSSATGVLSTIHSPEFFNTPEGVTSPKAELIATLRKVYAPVEHSPNRHAQCLFPARYMWLRQQLSLEAQAVTPPEIQCGEFLKWSLNGTTESISIVYATGYLGNPASYYGHTLLKMNSSDKNLSSKLLDISVNYGAIVPENEDPVSYIIKGVVGGYDAGFSHIEYYYHTHNYGENELRDLWEYKLELSQEEVDFVLAHTWEVLGKKYTYYFANKNCAYRMIELVEILDGIHITRDDAPWFLPQTVVQGISDTVRNGKPLLRDLEYHPSRQSRLYEKYSYLSSGQRRWVKRIINDIDILQSEDFTQEPIESKHLILDTLLDYYQTFGKDDQVENTNINTHYNAVLGQRYLLPPGKTNSQVSVVSAPHLGRSPSFAQLTAIENSELGSGLGINLRPAYYDVLDSSDSHVKYAALSMARLELTLLDDSVDIRNFDIVAIDSVSTKATGLPSDRTTSWKLKAGLEHQDLSCTRNCLRATLQADTGYSVTSNNVLLTAYAGGGFVDNRNNFGNIFVRGSVITVVSLNEKLRAMISLEHREYLQANKNKIDRLELSTRYSLSKNMDLRFTYRKDEAEEISLSLGHYW